MKSGVGGAPGRNGQIQQMLRPFAPDVSGCVRRDSSASRRVTGPQGEHQLTRGCWGCWSRITGSGRPDQQRHWQWISSIAPCTAVAGRSSMGHTLVMIHHDSEASAKGPSESLAAIAEGAGIAGAGEGSRCCRCSLLILYGLATLRTPLVQRSVYLRPT